MTAPRWRSSAVAGLLAASLLAGAACTLNVARAIGQPFGGYYANRSHSRNIWQVDAPTPPWWPGLAQGQLHYEDVLIALEGQPYGPRAAEIYAQARAEGRPTIRLTIQRGGQNLDRILPLRTFTPSNFYDIKLPDLINGLGFWLLAVAVFRTRPNHPVNQVFALATSLTATTIWLTIPALFPESGPASLALFMAWVLAAPFIGVSYIHLAILFPDPMRWPTPRWVGGLYGLMAVAAAAYALSVLLGRQASPAGLAAALGTFGNRAVIGMLAVGVTVFLSRLIYLSWRPLLSRRLRRQVRLLLISLALALPYILIIVFRALVHGSPSYYWSGLDIRFLALAVPLAFAFVILRYQTFRRTPPILIAVFILASSALVASGGAWLMRLLEPEWLNALRWPPFVPLFVAALIASIFWSTQSSWWGAFSRLFQWERRSYTAVQAFSRQVVGQIDLAHLPGVIATALVDRLELERAAVWLWDDGARAYSLAGQAGEWPVPPAARLNPKSAQTAGPVRLGVEGAVIPGWLQPLAAAAVLEMVAPLGTSGKRVGLLGLGKRWDEEIFDERDLAIIELIAQEAALFLLTALQVEALRQVPHQVATAQERERFKIAQELHDTVQQFLGRLPFYLEVSRAAARTNPAETEAVLQRSLAEVEHAAQTLRQIRTNLAPLQLEKSLTQPLALLAEHFHARTGLEMLLELSPEADALLSPTARHALYRVVQQALDNVAAHAQARQVTIRLRPANGQIHFVIADDGQGSSEAQRALAEDHGSFGLKSMQARITALGGEFTVESAPGAGTQIMGWLPASLPA